MRQALAWVWAWELAGADAGERPVGGAGWISRAWAGRRASLCGVLVGRCATVTLALAALALGLVLVRRGAARCSAVRCDAVRCWGGDEAGNVQREAMSRWMLWVTGQCGPGGDGDGGDGETRKKKRGERVRGTTRGSPYRQS